MIVGIKNLPVCLSSSLGSVIVLGLVLVFFNKVLHRVFKRLLLVTDYWKTQKMLKEQREALTEILLKNKSCFMRLI